MATCDLFDRYWSTKLTKKYCGLSDEDNAFRAYLIEQGFDVSTMGHKAHPDDEEDSIAEELSDDKTITEKTGIDLSAASSVEEQKLDLIIPSVPNVMK